ncbi:hypothetical protein SAMN02745181_3564 [Rubritalea squalenifaciens DSM 18772]|uniref:Uncharacterized protein n=1 Tax=Rubritalea squalenifaciens DSM 18772 TaxID=1123071 RepID=A0A1M6R7C8_9BACT|nr:hypothetical protein SAMN02745181_3564 [Rubritalea squalenifaciens DSM 18772]
MKSGFRPEATEHAYNDLQCGAAKGFRRRRGVKPVVIVYGLMSFDRYLFVFFHSMTSRVISIALEVGVLEIFAVEEAGTKTLASGKYAAAAPRGIS